MFAWLESSRAVRTTFDQRQRTGQPAAARERRVRSIPLTVAARRDTPEWRGVTTAGWLALQPDLHLLAEAACFGFEAAVSNAGELRGWERHRVRGAYHVGALHPAPWP